MGQPQMVDVNPDALSSVIGNIYNAAYDPARWQAAIDSLENLFQGSKACLQRVGPDLQLDDVVATKADPFFHTLFLRDFADAPNEFVDALSSLPVGSKYVDRLLYGEKTLRQSRFWNEWMAPQDMYGGIGIKLIQSGTSYWIFDVQRGRTQPAFGENEIELLRVLAPHITRATSLRHKFQSARVLSAAFDYLPFGIAVVDGHLRITSLNAKAEDILRRPESGILGKSGYLAVEGQKNMMWLQQMVGNVCRIHDAVQPGIGGDMMLRHTHNGESTSFAVSVAPLAVSQDEFSFMDPQAMIFIREVSLLVPPGFAEQIRSLFQLSPREATLAASLSAGRTLKEAAADNQIQVSTARSYLENIFQKTETRQQSQLVALLKSVHATPTGRKES